MKLNLSSRKTKLGVILYGILITSISINATDHSYFYKKAREYIKSLAPKNVKKLNVQFSSLPSYLKVDDCKKYIYKFEGINRFFGKRILKISCLNPKWSIFTQCNVSGKIPVIVASKNINYGELLNNKNTVKRYLSTQSLNGLYFQNFSEVLSSKSRFYIPKDHVIFRNMIKIKPLITIGQPINITYSKGSVYVKMLGVSLQSGTLGDIIKVRNKHSNKIIVGKIVNDSTIKPIM